MPQIIRAIYENGVFKPIREIKLPQHQEVEIVIPYNDSDEIILMAENGGSFDFLAEPGEDIYTKNDGEPT